MAIFRWGPEVSASKLHLALVDAVGLEMLPNKSWELRMIEKALKMNETERKSNENAQEMNETRWKVLK